MMRDALEAVHQPFKPETLASRAEAISNPAANSEILIGVQAAEQKRESPELAEIAMKVQLTRGPASGLSLGRLHFLSDGTLKIDGEVCSLSAIDEQGSRLGEKTMLYRSGNDLVGVKHGNKVKIFCYSNGYWYHGSM